MVTRPNCGIRTARVKDLSILVYVSDTDGVYDNCGLQSFILHNIDVLSTTESLRLSQQDHVGDGLPGAGHSKCGGERRRMLIRVYYYPWIF